MSNDTVTQRLTALRDELNERLARIRAHAGHREQAVDRDASEQAVQREDDEVVDQLSIRLDGELAAIDVAMARVAAGTYERCARCEAPIGAERLAALPLTAVCVSCADLK